MTVAYSPTDARTPELGPMVDGDLCDIRVREGGRFVYCLQAGVQAAMDADGATRILCATHKAKYFPNAI